ncbi:MAG: helix-turn-helix transcriptional regulator [Candidatus Cloacimonetes bacterium]|nr:helix-turn-helix transcriptional regulator [Candidatus Cloacimonadota bacterium]
MKKKNWLEEKISKYKDDEEYILEGVILNITEKIARKMYNLGWSKKKLATEMNVSSPFITKLLNGSNNFTLKTIVKLSVVLDIDLEYLLNVNYIEENDSYEFSISVNSHKAIASIFDGSKNIDILKNITFSTVNVH